MNTIIIILLTLIACFIVTLLIPTYTFGLVVYLRQKLGLYNRDPLYLKYLK